MKILAFGASTSSTSINKTLATYAAGLVANAQVTVLDLAELDVPLFSEDKEREIGQAPAAQQFLQAIADADAVIVSYAEHNGSYTAAYKNLFDWASRIEQKVFQNKPVVYLSTSPGPGGAATVLAAATQSAPYFGAQVKASLSVPSYYDNVDPASGTVTNAEIAEALHKAVATLTAN